MALPKGKFGFKKSNNANILQLPKKGFARLPLLDQKLRMSMLGTCPKGIVSRFLRVHL